MSYDNYKKTITECRANFSKHELTVLCDHEKVKRFQFRRPDSGCFGFSLTTADNLIVMNGDTYSLLIEPGYGRDGFWFLLSNINRDWSYLIGKCPNKRELLTEYSYESARDNLNYYVENEYITQGQADDADGLDGGSYWGQNAYYQFCHDHNIDDPQSPRVLTRTALNQIAGLQCFAEKYNELFPEKETSLEQ